jgi:hypothetical protein
MIDGNLFGAIFTIIHSDENISEYKITKKLVMVVKRTTNTSRVTLAVQKR